MAIKERKPTGKATAPNNGTVRRSGPYLLTAAESASLLQSLSAPPKPLSPEVKRAIANYKRIKAAFGDVAD
jgi:hypothetical protein